MYLESCDYDQQQCMVIFYYSANDNISMQSFAMDWR